MSPREIKRLRKAREGVGAGGSQRGKRHSRQVQAAERTLNGIKQRQSLSGRVVLKVWKLETKGRVREESEGIVNYP